MAIRPCCVAAGGRARAIEEARLRQQQVGPVTFTTVPCRLLRRSDFVQARAEVDRACPTAEICLPGNRCGQRPIHLANARAALKVLVRTAIPGRNSLTRKLQELLRRNIQQYSVDSHEIGK